MSKYTIEEFNKNTVYVRLPCDYIGEDKIPDNLQHWLNDQGITPDIEYLYGYVVGFFLDNEVAFKLRWA